MGWQPIETAPKDGTEIDVWCVDHRVANAWWCNADNKWRTYGDDRITWTHQPTHWMPLPEAPNAKFSGAHADVTEAPPAVGASAATHC